MQRLMLSEGICYQLVCTCGLIVICGRCGINYRNVEGGFEFRHWFPADRGVSLFMIG